MATPADPRIVAEVGGFVVAEDGPLVVVVDRGPGSMATIAFVLGVLGAVTGGFAAVAPLLAATES